MHFKYSVYRVGVIALVVNNQRITTMAFAYQTSKPHHPGTMSNTLFQLKVKPASMQETFVKSFLYAPYAGHKLRPAWQVYSGFQSKIKTICIYATPLTFSS